MPLEWRTLRRGEDATRSATPSGVDRRSKRAVQRRIDDRTRCMPSSSPRIAFRAAALRRLWTVLLGCAIFTSSAQALAQEATAVNDIIPFPTATKTLGNGLQVIVMPMPSSGLVAFWSIVRTGSRDEYEPGRSGFAHFFEHMMFRGTERYPPARYLEVTT